MDAIEVAAELERVKRAMFESLARRLNNNGEVDGVWVARFDEMRADIERLKFALANVPDSGPLVDART